jgi:drug/metabolite transporter (DMT)-like permease
MRSHTGLLTVLTLLAFAANSVLCRIALKQDLIDPIAFTQIRLLSGAFVLTPFLIRRRTDLFPLRAGHWQSALALFVYAITFSLAYVALDAGTGALILFALVQISMIGLGIMAGARPGLLEWTGLGVAFAGLIYLFAPGLSAPPLVGALLMAVSGIAWGIYSRLGRGEADPIASTARNFILTVPLALLLFLGGPSWSSAAPAGIALAVASGALASGIGYVLWYSALKGLPNMTASVAQLAVPIIAAIGGILFIGESVSLRLAISTALILGGIYVTIRGGAKDKA